MRYTYICDPNLRSLLSRVDNLLHADKLANGEERTRVVSVFFDGDDFIAILEVSE